MNVNLLQIVNLIPQKKEIFKIFRTFPVKKQKQIFNAVLIATYLFLDYSQKIKEINKLLKKNPNKYFFLPIIINFFYLQQFTLLYMVLNIDLNKKYLRPKTINNSINDIDIGDIENKVKSLREGLKGLRYKKRNNYDILENKLENKLENDLD
tara:strand:- start:60 stop:515 length:456 start_codon:yes stop_codon:yes gene_type:complete